MKTKEQSIIIGQLNKEVTFQYVTTATDTMGGRTPTWNTLITAWCNIKPLDLAATGEKVNVEAIKAQQAVKIETRYRDDFITQGYDSESYDYNLRAIYNNQIFNIKYALNAGYDDHHVIMYAIGEVGNEI